MRALKILLLAVAGTMLSACGYNSIQVKDEATKSAWSEVLNQYQRRADLIPNLVNTVKGFAAQEQAVLIGVTEARAKATQTQVKVDANDPASLQQFQQAQGELSSALSRLMVVVEKYPELKSDQNFRDLQAQLEGTENRITVARNRYIQAVQDYNVTVRQFPVNLTAMVFGQGQAELRGRERGSDRQAADSRVQSCSRPDAGSGPHGGPGTESDPPARSAREAPLTMSRSDSGSLRLAATVFPTAAALLVAAAVPAAARADSGSSRRVSPTPRHACARSGRVARGEAGGVRAVEGQPGGRPDRADDAAGGDRSVFDPCRRAMEARPKKVDDGVLLIVALNDRRMRIEVGYGLEGALPDATANRIIQQDIAPAFKRGDYYGGINTGVDRILRVIEDEPLPEPELSPPSQGIPGLHNLLPFLFIFALVGSRIFVACSGGSAARSPPAAWSGS